LTGPKVQQIRAKVLQDLGIITPIKIKCLHINHNNPEIEEQLKKLRKNPNLGAEAYRLEGEFIRRSEKRLKLIWKLINKVKTNTLILFNIIEYGTIIKETLEKEYENYVRTSKLDEIVNNTTCHKEYEFLYVDGDISKKDRAEVKRKMELEDGIIRILVASYGTFSTGISINNIHNIILAEGFKSEVRIIQSLGRSLRLHESKKQALIFDIVDLLTETGRGSYSRQGDKRKTIYNEHQYPYDVVKINL
jgi:superfamily II DNA or RNA helicase